MKTPFFCALSLIGAIGISLMGCQTPPQNAKTATLHVYGNCGMCKKTIESAANKSGISQAVWGVDSKMLTLTYDSSKTTPQEVLRRVADAGYDSDAITAPDNAYFARPECCQYTRKAASEQK